MITFNLTTILIIAALAVVVLYFTWPAFRQMLQIRGGKAVDGMSSASEKQRHEYKRLTGELEKQLDNVAAAKAGAEMAEKEVTDAKAQVEKLTGQYKLAVSSNAAESLLNDLAAKVAKAKASVTSKQAIAAEAAKVAEEAVAALDGTREALKDFADQIDDTEQKEALTKVLNTSADAANALRNIKDRIGVAGDAQRQADGALAKARAKNDLTKGSANDQAMAQIEKDAAAKAAREALDAELGITKKQ